VLPLCVPLAAERMRARVMVRARSLNRAPETVHKHRCVGERQAVGQVAGVEQPMSRVAVWAADLCEIPAVA
jgi:hypothetical protein